MITITETARKKFLEVTKAEGKKDHGLRVIVRGGGTAMPQFALNFVAPDGAGEDDVIEEAGEVKVYMDPESAKFLDGATVDFIDILTESGFKIDAPNAGIPKPTGPVAEAVMRVLDEKINPGVAAHGGHVSLVAIEGDTAYLSFGGGCQGCGMINVTLKEGVEKALFEEVPQITRVMDITDHAAGANPYYHSGK
jgi:Fe/S biogenesis protein NfuA